MTREWWIIQTGYYYPVKATGRPISHEEGLELFGRESASVGENAWYFPEYYTAYNEGKDCFPTEHEAFAQIAINIQQDIEQLTKKLVSVKTFDIIA